MASSKKLPPSNASCSTTDNELLAHLEGFLAPLVRPRQTLLIAFSGGLDSRVLLDILVKLRPILDFQLLAMHVHHGLSPNADRWAEFCAETCQELNVSLEIVNVVVPRDSGHGLEAAARKLRYDALRQSPADYVVLAHHEDDQAETLLLQLLRGAGTKGLAGMARVDANRKYLRPLLDVPRDRLLAYAKRHGLKWIEDESNADIGYDRNYCRHEILPLIERRFPAAKHTLARTASHLAEASMLLDELAQLDAGDLQPGQLEVSRLQQLSAPRARNLLRWWLSTQQQPMPSSVRLEEMLRQLLSARTDAGIKIAVDQEAWLRRYHGQVYLEKAQPVEPFLLKWQGETVLMLPDNTSLRFEERSGQGLALKHLGSCQLSIKSRRGGERFQPDRRRPQRTLKHLLQEAGVPPWQRERLPLIYCNDKLAMVPGIGTAAALQAVAGEPGLDVTWQQC